ncbi:hypothetical protein PGIGA_G00095120 [Pangasianodon gigas]|uniref:Uncharacterized protein n=1 Tax=Pangasianodon gigas TaxID=30993 RepID=A0ACC5XDI3_PANGG|nr:hypothetical protein [Pangasianodon gigas]
MDRGGQGRCHPNLLKLWREVFPLALATVVPERGELGLECIPDTSAQHISTSSSAASHSSPCLHSDGMRVSHLSCTTLSFFLSSPGMREHPPISVCELADHIERLKANDNLLFSQEYESIDPGQQFTCENSNMEVNKLKNRYANVIAYDHSRVVLTSVDAVPGSNYINANYIDGYRKQNTYIATQDPLPETFSDFWRMVWEQRTSTIIMLTRMEEKSQVSS